MILFGKPEGVKYHTRSIEVTTYGYDEHRLVVEGCLKDERFQEFYLATGEKKLPCIVHHIIVQLLIKKTNLEIEDLCIKMPAVPYQECMKITDGMNPVKGLKIAGGFRSTVKALAGCGQGCTHTIELLTVMGSSTIQGYFAYKQRESPLSTSTLIKMLEDTCWTWRSAGPVIDILKEIDAKLKNGQL
jgi:hypothetical protein